MGFLNLFKKDEQIILSNGKKLVKAQPVKRLNEKDYGMTLIEALDLQNFFEGESATRFNEDNVLYMTPTELKQSALFFYQTKKPTLDHIVNCINGTRDINTFFKSIDKLAEMTNILSKFEKLHIYSPGCSPSEQFRTNIDNMPSIEEHFIERNYTSFIEKLESLKMESAKQKRLKKYFLEWSLFYNRMCPESVGFIERLRKEWRIDLYNDQQND